MKHREGKLQATSDIMGRMARIATRFINLQVEDIDGSIRDAIAEIGTLLEVDRVCTYLFNLAESGFFKLFQWDAGTSIPQDTEMGTQAMDKFPWLMGHIAKRDIVIINSLEDVPIEASSSRKMMQDRGVVSALIIPLVWRDTVDGFICIDSLSVIRNWSNEEIAAFELLASSITGALKHKTGETALLRSKEELRTLNGQLESQVRDRTRSLEESMERLSKSQEFIIQQEKLSSIGQLAAGMAHEINNPTGYIMSNLYIFKEYFDQLLSIILEYDSLNEIPNLTQASIQAVLSKIGELKNEIDFEHIRKDGPELVIESLQGTERIKGIVLALQGYARSSANDKELVSIEELLDRAIKLSWNELKYKCEMLKDYHDVPMVFARENQLLQVFINILLNAAQAIQKKGTISIATSKHGPNILITIRDTGIGIPPEDLLRIMEPFYTTKPVGQGTGLGLSISQSIIAEHGGTIEVISEVGVGTTFTITLPWDGKRRHNG